MAIKIKDLITLTLARTNQHRGSEAGGLSLGVATGTGGMDPTFRTPDFLLEAFAELTRLLTTPSPYNCVLLEGEGTATLNITPANPTPGVVPLSSLSNPNLWRVRQVMYNGYPMARIGANYKALYCSGGRMPTGEASMFEAVGDPHNAIRLMPPPKPGTGVTTGTVWASGYVTPTIPAAELDELSFLPDEDLKVLYPAYGIMRLAEKNPQRSVLAAVGASETERLLQVVWSKYNALDRTARESAFRLMTAPPIRNQGTLRTRKAQEE
jgi:hypothetical protein